MILSLLSCRVLFDKKAPRNNTVQVLSGRALHWFIREQEVNPRSPPLLWGFNTVIITTVVKSPRFYHLIFVILIQFSVLLWTVPHGESARFFYAGSGPQSNEGTEKEPNALPFNSIAGKRGLMSPSPRVPGLWSLFFLIKGCLLTSKLNRTATWKYMYVDCDWLRKDA